MLTDLKDGLPASEALGSETKLLGSEMAFYACYLPLDDKDPSAFPVWLGDPYISGRFPCLLTYTISQLSTNLLWFLDCSSFTADRGLVFFDASPVSVHHRTSD